MVSKVVEDPFAGEAQWVLDVAARRLPRVANILEWYETYPIPVLQLRTASELVRSGNARTVVAYLDSLA